jgi:hypothetical protein
MSDPGPSAHIRIDTLLLQHSTHLLQSKIPEYVSTAMTDVEGPIVHPKSAAGAHACVDPGQISDKAAAV